MGARKIPRPPNKTPNSPDEIVHWLEYLCLNSSCRGMAGYELSQATELLDLNVLRLLSDDGSAEERARQLRQFLVASFGPSAGDDTPHHRAVMHLLGLSNPGFARPRAERRKLAAEAFDMPIDTFQKSYERAILRDVAAEVWRFEMLGRSPDGRAEVLGVTTDE